MPTILIQVALNKLLIISSNYFGHEFYLNKNNSYLNSKTEYCRKYNLCLRFPQIGQNKKNILPIPKEFYNIISKVYNLK